MALVTVFETRLGDDDMLRALLVAAGVGAVLLALAWRDLRRLDDDAGLVRRLGARLVTGVAAVLVLGALSLAWQQAQQTRELIALYRTGKAQVAEGPVTVLHTQPYSGHTGGDRLRIGDQEFEVDYFQSGPGYHLTLAHGGVLNAGVQARVYHRDGVIIAVQLPADAAR